MSAIGLLYLFIRIRIAYMGILKRVARLLDPQKKFKREVIEYCASRHTYITYGDAILLKFVRFTKKASISEVSKEDIYLFRDEISRTTSEYHMKVAMIAIRSLLRYYKGRKVICVDPTCIQDNETNLPMYDSLSDMKGSTIPKPDRNRELVQLRISNPNLSWAKIGDQFGITRARAYNTFRQHALKYVEPQKYKQYQDIMEGRVIHN